MTALPLIGISLGFMVLDIITGLVKAWHEHDMQSSKLRHGLFHKAGFILVIVAAQFLEYAAAFAPDLDLDLPLTTVVCTYVIITEVVSILENAAVINPAIRGIMNRFPAHDDVTHAKCDEEILDDTTVMEPVAPPDDAIEEP